MQRAGFAMETVGDDASVSATFKSDSSFREMARVQCTFDVPIAGGEVAIQFHFSDGWPFKAPKLSLQPSCCADFAALKQRLRLVCPELKCWEPDDEVWERVLGWELRFPLLTDMWSPTTRLLSLISHIDARLRSPSLSEAALAIASAAPSTTAGVVVVDVGGGSDLPPLPPSAEQDALFVLLDPHWVAPCAHHATHWVAPCAAHATPTEPVWWSCGTATYVALGAPYPWDDKASVEALRGMLSVLAEKGYTSVVLQKLDGNFEYKYLPEDRDLWTQRGDIFPRDVPGLLPGLPAPFGSPAEQAAEFAARCHRLRASMPSTLHYDPCRLNHGDLGPSARVP